jgi:hypothetical protein
MNVLVLFGREPEGRRASQAGLVEGGRYLRIPQNRRSVPAGVPPPADGVLLTRPAMSHDQPQPSPFFVSHFRGSLQS